MEKIRVGIVGLGIGRAHLKGYLEHPAAEVVAVCDSDRQRLEAVGEEYRVRRRYASAEEMFAQAPLDAVSIAVPNHLHLPLALAAFKARLHVLCEKPPALDARGAAAMERAARAAGRQLMINFSQRFTPQSQALKRQVDAGALGQVYFGRTAWHRRRNLPRFGGWFGRRAEAGGGPLIDIGIHRLDLALWLMGHPEPCTVSGTCHDLVGRELARRERRDFDVEDLACALVRFHDGATLILEASWAAHVGEEQQMSTTLCGTRGGLLQRNVGGGYGGYEAFIYSEENGSLVTRRLDRSLAPATSSYAEFIDSIREGRPPAADGAQGVAVMRILDAVYQSAATGREVVLAAEPATPAVAGGERSGA